MKNLNDLKLAAISKDGKTLRRNDEVKLDDGKLAVIVDVVESRLDLAVIADGGTSSTAKSVQANTVTLYESSVSN